MKAPDVLDVAHQLRADPRIDWPSVVQNDAWDVSECIPASLCGYLGLDPANSIFNRALLGFIVAAERGADKPLGSLRTPEDIKLALDAFKSWAPDLLISLWRKQRLEREHLRAVLLDVWRYTDLTSVWPSRTWRSMFRAAGFLSDGAPRPRRPIILYRGCTPRGSRGFSWTLYRWRAENFANYWFNLGQASAPGHVYKAKVAPSDILAIISGHNTSATLPDGTSIKGGGEDEVVVDARAIEPILMETARQRHAREAREEAALQRRFERLKRLQRTQVIDG